MCFETSVYSEQYGGFVSESHEGSLPENTISLF